ncbi:hypothetical protein RKD47_000334 [Streptomyces albogriseolus]
MVASDVNVPAPASSSAMLLSTSRTSAPALRALRAMPSSPRTTLTTSRLSSPSYQAPAYASPSMPESRVARSEASPAFSVLGAAAAPSDAPSWDALALGSRIAAAPRATTAPTAAAALRFGIRL